MHTRRTSTQIIDFTQIESSDPVDKSLNSQAEWTNTKDDDLSKIESDEVDCTV